MNEKKKVTILLGIVFCVILFIIIGSIYENSKSKKYLKDFYSAFNGSENKLVMIGRDNCSWCQLFKPSLDFMHDNYNLEYLYINTNELTSSSFNKLLKEIGVKSEEFGTPYTVVVSNGKVVDSLNGYTDEVELLDFLKKYKFVSNDVKLPLNYIDYSSYKKILKSSDTNIVVIGQTSCGYCIKAKPILNQIAVDKKVKINYLNITNLSDEEKNKFGESLSYLKENDWGTPLTLIIKDGKVIDSLNGLRDYDGYLELFDKNGLVK